MHDAIKNHDLNYVLDNIQTDSFDKFSQAAYDSDTGYAIRKNPYTGETEMFVKGTSDTIQWIQDVTDARNQFGPTYEPIRDAYVEELNEAAKAAGVTVVYGHSRGGALVDQMRVPGAAFLELDGADSIDNWASKKAGHTTWNIIQNNWFDKQIARGGKDVTVVDTEEVPYYVDTPAGKKANMKFHRVSRNHKGYHYDYETGRPVYTQGNRKRRRY